MRRLVAERDRGIDDYMSVYGCMGVSILILKYMIFEPFKTKPLHLSVRTYNSSRSNGISNSNSDILRLFSHRTQGSQV